MNIQGARESLNEHWEGLPTTIKAITIGITIIVGVWASLPNWGEGNNSEALLYEHRELNHKLDEMNGNLREIIVILRESGRQQYRYLERRSFNPANNRLQSP